MSVRLGLPVVALLLLSGLDPLPVAAERAPGLDAKRAVARHWRVPRKWPAPKVALRPRPADYGPATELHTALEGIGEAKTFVLDRGPRLPKRTRHQARKAFSDFAEHVSSFVRVGTKLTPERQGALSRELVARAVQALRVDGVEFALRYRPPSGPRGALTEIELLPTGKHRLNRTAANLAKSVDGLRLKYTPWLMIARNSSAALDKADNVVYLGHDVIERKGLRRLPVALHELRHARNHRDARAKKPSPYHGSADKAEGELPTTFQRLYSDHQGIDELQTYALTLRTGLHLQSQRLRTGKNLGQYRKNMDRGIFAVIQHGLSLSARTVTMAKQSLGTIGRGATKVEYRDNKGLVEATWLVGRANKRYRMTVPLTKSAGTNDGRNATLLSDQLRWMRGAAKNNLTLFRVAAKAFDKIQGTTDLRDKRALIRALGKVMNQRAIERDPTAKPLGIDDGIRLFNQQAKALGAR